MFQEEKYCKKLHENQKFFKEIEKILAEEFKDELPSDHKIIEDQFSLDNSLGLSAALFSKLKKNDETEAMFDKKCRKKHKR